MAAVPAGHVGHTTAKPARALAVPAGHVVHLLGPCAYVPAGHVLATYEQVRCPVVLYAPIAHALHAKVEEAKVPAGHSVLE